MEALVDWLKDVFGKKWIWVLPFVVLSLFLYYLYSSERSYHQWASSYKVHNFYTDRVEYSDGKLRVFWMSWPKTAPYGFEEQYVLYRPVGEPIGIAEYEHPYPKAAPYRHGYSMDDTNMKFPNAWGSWIDVGKLEPGVYQLEIRYDYDPWWLPDWTADQRIVFTVN